MNEHTASYDQLLMIRLQNIILLTQYMSYIAFYATVTHTFISSYNGEAEVRPYAPTTSATFLNLVVSPSKYISLLQFI